MGDLNNIQDEIYAEMSGDLADVSFPFSGQNVTTGKFDPDNPRGSQVVTNYEGEGIFGLSFNVTDSEVFQIQLNDQKAICFERYTTREPKNQDKIVYDNWVYLIIDHKVIPAGNGWVLQLRAMSKTESENFLNSNPTLRA